MIIAIDGPAGSGKSSTARGVARRLGYLYLDTGAMYRAVALAFLRSGADATTEEASRLLPKLTIDIRYQDGEMQVVLDGSVVSEAIRDPKVGQMASRVSTLPTVRDKLVAEQQRIGQTFRENPGVVIDGRDIGTVVFPDADLKIFMVADAKVRAKRRQAELAEKGTVMPFEEVLAEMQQRDRQDSERALSPLRRADDAIDLDTTHCTLGDQIQFVIDKAGERA
ncbi:MAG TPA: (d)CMP kinase [Rhodothermales bacterium]|nr:(d)CMP kinase [Rhodothermales bacterium]